MHDRRVEAVGEGHDLGELENGSRDLLGRHFLRLPMPVADQPAKIAALDIIVLQIRRLAIEVGILQRDDTSVESQLLGLKHDSIDHLGLVMEHTAGLCVCENFKATGTRD